MQRSLCVKAAAHTPRAILWKIGRRGEGNYDPKVTIHLTQDCNVGRADFYLTLFSLLAIRDVERHIRPMTATLTIDDAGQIILPEALKRVFGVEPGVRLRAEVTSDRIEIVKDIPVVTETARSSSGRLVLARTGIAVDAAKAVREERDAFAKDIPVVTEGVLENGVLVLPKLGIKMDAGAAIRADRDEQAERARHR